MKLLQLTLLCIIVGCANSPPTATTPAAATPQHPEMLELCERFLTAPLETSPAEVRQILQFFAKSPDVIVVVDPVVAPWISEALDNSAKQLLLAGFLAADGSSQLRSGQKADDMYAGVAGTLRVYRALKARNVTSPSMEAFAALDAKGELRAHLDDMLASRPH